MSDTSGLSSRTPLAFYDPDSGSLKTSALTFLSDSTSSSPTLPVSGMTRRGALYALPMSERVTDGPDFSSLPTPRATRGGSATETIYALGGERTDEDRTQGQVVLPTPRTGPNRSSRRALTMDGHWSAPSLEQALELVRGILPREYESWEEVQGWHGALLRTPQAAVTEAKPGIKLTGRTPADPQVGLADQVMALLPTPAAQESDPTEEYVEEMREHFDPSERMYLPGQKWFAQRTLSRVAALLPTPTVGKGGGRGPDWTRGERPDSGGDDLVTSVAKLLPTPDAAMGLGGHERRGGARSDELLLAGLAKEVSSGAPTQRRSPATPSSSADAPLTLWTEEDD